MFLRAGWRLAWEPLTPAELYARRFESPRLGLVLFLFFTAYTVPYMVSAVVGASVTLSGMTGGAVPAWAGGLGVVAVALLYTTLGGMQATAWTNVFQGSLFMIFLLVAVVLIVGDLGGPAPAMESVQTVRPDLLGLSREGPFAPAQWISWGLLISMTVIAFPHMFVRLLAARSERALQGVCRLYPLGLLLLWLPPVLIGVWGAAEFPGLEGRASDGIFQMMMGAHLPPWLAAVGLVAVLAAVMSSLDAMILTLSSMLVRDALGPLRRGRSGRSEVLAGRCFSLLVAVVVFILSRVWGRSVVEIAAVGFSGYVTLTPALALGVRWRRFTARGAMASLLVGNAVLFLGLSGRMPLFGFMPVFWAFLAALIAGVVVSLAGPPSEIRLTARAFDG